MPHAPQTQPCLCTWLPELEPVWAALCLLQGEQAPMARCAEVYGAPALAAWRQEYRWLVECYAAARHVAPVMLLDYLLDLPAESCTLAAYQAHVQGQSAAAFVARQLDIAPSEAAAALSDDAALAQLYARLAQNGESFLAFSAFVRQSGRFVAQFFALARAMQTPALQRYLQACRPAVEQKLAALRAGTAGGDLLAFSQQEMGKTFKNRGPYAQFVFSPACLLPCRALRFFGTEGPHRRQLLFLAVEPAAHDRQDTLRALKAIADPTRYQILTLLAEEGPQRGLDIARRLGLAASTVSHHMDQLKEGGLLTEEQVKNAKFFGLDRQNAAALLQALQIDWALPNGAATQENDKGNVQC